jgi:hypothetical protein
LPLLTRTPNGLIDIGAYEYGNTLNSDDNLFTTPAFTIYPNPSHGKFQVLNNDSNLESNYSFTVYTIEGKKIYSKPKLDSKTIDFDLSAFPKGIYLIKRNDGHKKQSKKIIIN